ncbi:MAG: hypothetical protein WBN83_18720 [Desulfoprunum sp.]|jgi:hypothetical protein|uniref:hypothetical protein n=1 Tax=Desulfoprunum sp. TaxID=2020866 RepID=UPI000A4F3287
MNKTRISLLLLAVCGVFFATAAGAADCSGGWKVLPGYQPGSGGVCAAMGLNTNAGVCLPGQRYETLCDDASGGRYRTCQGARQCYDDRRRGDDDYRRGDRGRRRGGDDGCRGWDYSYDQPCPPGYINRDCRGGCEPY